MHQDILSAKFCGEGIPDWAVQTKMPFHFLNFPFPYKKAFTAKDFDENGIPLRSSCGGTFPNASFALELDMAYEDL